MCITIQPYKDTNTHLGDTKDFLCLGLAQTLIEASAGDVAENLPRPSQLRGGGVQDLFKHMIYRTSRKLVAVGDRSDKAIQRH